MLLHLYGCSVDQDFANYRNDKQAFVILRLSESYGFLGIALGKTSGLLQAEKKFTPIIHSFSPALGAASVERYGGRFSVVLSVFRRETPEMGETPACSRLRYRRRLHCGQQFVAHTRQANFPKKFHRAHSAMSSKAVLESTGADAGNRSKVAHG